MSDSFVSWRSELLSEAHGLATIAIADGRIEQLNEAAARMCGARAGMMLEDIFDSEGGRRACELASRAATGTLELCIKRAGGIRRAFLFLALPPGGVLVTSPIERAAPDERSSGVVPTARDAAAEAAPRDESKLVNDGSSLPSEVMSELPSNDVYALFHTIALQAQALTLADYVAVGIGCDPTQPFDPWVSVGMSRDVARKIGRVPHPIGLLGIVAREGKLLRLANASTDPRSVGLPKHHPPIASFLGVPIRYQNKAVGNLYLGNVPGGRELTDEDERKIVTLAASAGAAIESASLYVREKRHRAWLRSVIDQMPHAVLLYDEHGKVVAMNRAYAALCCEEPCVDKFGNKLAVDIRSCDGRPIAIEDLPMVRAFERHAPTFHEEARVRLCDGHLMPVVISSIPVRDNRGNVTGVATVIEDISERKSLERMREEWTAVVAHDLRQPVGVVSLAADLLYKLHEAEWSDRDRKIIDRIRSASSLLSRMISDLTDASLIESRQLSFSLERVSVEALVNSVIESIDAAAARFHVRVKVEGEREACIDPDRIRQVIGNLVSNAVKYGQPGTEIEVAVLGTADVVEIVVTNRGPGIAPEHLPHLFNRFERARARETKTAGLGLGLYIAKGIVEAHGGRIWVESTPNQTTSFHVVLPRMPARESTERECPSSY